MRKLIGWNGQEIGLVPDKGQNPMLRHGSGPEGKTCGDCAHLLKNNHRGCLYWKCDLYKLSHGGASDFRKKWPACKKFEQQAGARETIYSE
jgi:hypothetical protein